MRHLRNDEGGKDAVSLAEGRSWRKQMIESEEHRADHQEEQEKGCDEDSAGN